MRILDVVESLAAVVSAVVGVVAIVWGAERFAEHLARASAGLGVSTFALALLLAGAEPEELATAVTATVRDAPAIAFGDAIGANVAICLVALAVGAMVAPLPFGRRVLRYAVLGVPVGVGAVALAWDGELGRMEGGALVGLYVAYVGAVWIAERAPPTLGETAELAEAAEVPVRRLGKDFVYVLAGLASMVMGATLLVDGIRDLVDAEADQTKISLTVVGFATGFELVALAWSAARRGISEAVVAGVVGSYAYNATMTLGAAALVRPLRMTDASLLHAPTVAMLLALVAVLALATPGRALRRHHGYALLAAYLVFLAVALGA